MSALTRPERRLRFGQRLRELRKAAGLTQAEVADACGIDHTYLSKIESGKMGNLPSPETVYRMALVLIPRDAPPLGSAWQLRDELLLLSGRIPRDVQDLILAHPESVALLRERYGRSQ